MGLTDKSGSTPPALAIMSSSQTIAALALAVLDRDFRLKLAADPEKALNEVGLTYTEKLQKLLQSLELDQLEGFHWNVLNERLAGEAGSCGIWFISPVPQRAPPPPPPPGPPGSSAV